MQTCTNVNKCYCNLGWSGADCSIQIEIVEIIEATSEPEVTIKPDDLSDQMQKKETPYGRNLFWRMYHIVCLSLGSHGILMMWKRVISLDLLNITSSLFHQTFLSRIFNSILVIFNKSFCEKVYCRYGDGKERRAIISRWLGWCRLDKFGNTCM